MTSGTKIVLAIIGLMVGIMIAYYGFLMPGETQDAPVIQDPAAAVDDQTPATAELSLDPPTERGPAPITMGQPDRRSSAAQDRAAISPPAEPPSGSMAGAGSLRPTSAAVETVPPLAARPGSGWTPSPRSTPSDGGKETPVGPAATTTTGSAPATGPAAMKSRTLPPPTRTQTPSRGPASADQRTSGQPGSARNRNRGQDQPPARVRRPATDPKPPVTRRDEAPQYTRYTVRSGDTMSSIAGDWFGDEGKWDLIAKANPLVDPNKLQIGQRLRLPSKETKRTPRTVRAGREAKTYVVRSGDTLSGIAKAHYGSGTDWRRIFDANRALIGSRPDDLKVGMKLTIPPAK